jgi:hypothetical protein
MLGCVPDRRVRVTARSRRNGPIRKRSSSVRCGDGSARFQKSRTPTGTGASAPHQECEWKQGESAIGKGGRKRASLEAILRRGERNSLRQQGIWNPPFPFPPSGASRGGRVPPTPEARCAPAKKRWHASSYRLPPQEGSAPLCIPHCFFTGKRVDKVGPLMEAATVTERTKVGHGS